MSEGAYLALNSRGCGNTETAKILQDADSETAAEPADVQKSETVGEEVETIYGVPVEIVRLDESSLD